MENKISIVAFTIFIVILFQISAHAQMGSSTTKKSGPLPSPNVEGLDEFQKSRKLRRDQTTNQILSLP